MTLDPATRTPAARQDEAGGNMYVGPSLGRSLMGVAMAIARGVDLSDVGETAAPEGARRT
jgi:hypothetical protein